MITESKIRLNGITCAGQVKSICGKMIYNAITKMLSWEILANVSQILTCSIFRKSCNGSCKIPAVMKLAEKTIPSGSHRTRYGLAVYEGMK